jgi:hypothetical protein
LVREKSNVWKSRDTVPLKARENWKIYTNVSTHMLIAEVSYCCLVTDLRQRRWLGEGGGTAWACFFCLEPPWTAWLHIISHPRFLPAHQTLITRTNGGNQWRGGHPCGRPVRISVADKGKYGLYFNYSYLLTRNSLASSRRPGNDQVISS